MKVVIALLAVLCSTAVCLDDDAELLIQQAQFLNVCTAVGVTADIDAITKETDDFGVIYYGELRGIIIALKVLQQRLSGEMLALSYCADQTLYDDYRLLAIQNLTFPIDYYQAFVDFYDGLLSDEELGETISKLKDEYSPVFDETIRIHKELWPTDPPQLWLYEFP